MNLWKAIRRSISQAETGSIFQLLTLIGLIAGLLLVVYELEETRRLTEVQLASESWNVLLAESRSLMGDDVASSLAKDCMGDDQLTDADKVRITGWLEHLWFRALRLRTIEDVGEFGASSEASDRAIMGAYLSQPLGRLKYQNDSDDWPDVLRIAADQLMSEQSYDDCRIHWTIAPAEGAESPRG